MTTPADLHGWFRRRLPAFVSGLLDEAEERRFLDHRAECEDCRRAFDEFTASDEFVLTERGAHIPAPMLARWAEARRELRGIERAMVRAHLERCADCRVDLERAGQTPELEFVAALEAAPGEGGWRAWLSGRAPRSGAARIVEAVSEPGRRGATRHVRPRRDWRPWVLGGWATAATAVVIALVMSPPPAPVRPGGVPGGEAVLMPEVPPQSGPPAGYLLEALPSAGALQGALRGPGEDETVIRLSGEARFVHLALPEMFLPDSEVVALRVLGPAGDELLQVRRTYAELSGRRTLLFGRADTVLAPGPYRLVVESVPPAQGTLGEFRFRLSR